MYKASGSTVRHDLVRKEKRGDMKRFPNKRIVITGAASGLGRSVAVEFAKLGWKVMVADVNRDGADETVEMVKQSGGESMAAECDVTRYEQVENLAELAVSQWGGADIVVNNAGVLAVGSMEAVSLEDWKWILDINLMGVIHGCRAFVPLMKQQKNGYIVNVASAAGFCALAEMSPYNVTKAGVISLSETLKPELKSYNIGVSVVCPTFFPTHLMDRTRSTHSKAYNRMDAFFQKSIGTAEGVSRHIIRSIRKNRFYVVTQPDAKLWWFLKRHFPNLYLSFQSIVFGRGILDKVIGV